MKLNQNVIVVIAVILIVAAGFIVFRTVTAPPETIGNYKSIPPKGAGKGDPEGRGGG